MSLYYCPDCLTAFRCSIRNKDIVCGFRLRECVWLAANTRSAMQQRISVCVFVMCLRSFHRHHELRKVEIFSDTPQHLFPPGKSPFYILDRRQGGAQCWSICGGENKLSLTEMKELLAGLILKDWVGATARLNIVAKRKVRARKQIFFPQLHNRPLY
jgi:hypothetical protein